MGMSGRTDSKLRREVRDRILSWFVLAPLMIAPVLLGAAWTIAGVAILSLLCHWEFSRATGLFRQHWISLIVIAGILAITFAVADNWYGFFVALPPLTVGIIAAAGILPDQPSGYIQRVALGIFAFLLFGVCLGHLGFMANDAGYRPIILMLFLTVELNDVFAFLAGKCFGRRKLAPNTSPGKTLEGAIGVLVGTTALVVALGHFVFARTAMDDMALLIGLGLLVSVVGQMGDLTLSSIKRDLGIKDMGVTIPGHGGLLDRFDSLIFVAPAFFHYVHYFLGIAMSEPARIISGG
jgi:phosphatidate cytidylyltransferase